MIQIIDGFKLNASTPIDSRFVVADDTERNNITYLYHGLRVWQKNTNTPWFYDGTQWVSELDLVVTGLGTVDNVPKITSSSPLKIGDSQITDNGTIVNITNNLTVGTDITFSGNLNGPINANNITTGILSLNILQTGSPGQVLQMDGSTPNWVNLNTLSIGTSTRSDMVKISSTNASDDYRLVLMKDGSTLGDFNQLYSKNAGIKVKEASDGLRILAHDGAVDRPPYSFDNSDNSGIYYNSGIYLSINGVNKAKIDSTGLKFGLGSVTNPSLSGFGTKTIGVPGPGGSTTVSFDGTGFYFDSYYTSWVGARKYLKFASNGVNSVSFTDFGLNIHSHGDSTKGIVFGDFVTLSYSSIYTDSTKTQLNFATGATPRFIISGGSAVGKYYGSNYLYGKTLLESKSGYPLYVKQSDSVVSAGLFVDVDANTTYNGAVPFGVRTGNKNKLLVLADGTTRIYDKVQILNEDFSSHLVYISTTLSSGEGGWIGTGFSGINKTSNSTTKYTDSYSSKITTYGVEMPSEYFDRIISFNGIKNGDSEIIICKMYVQKKNGSYYTNQQSGFHVSNGNYFGSATIFVPAGRKWACYIYGLYGGGGTNPMGNITIQKFGRTLP